MRKLYFIILVTFCFGTLYSQLDFEILNDGKVNLGSGQGAGLLHLGFNSSNSFPTLRLTEVGSDFARITLENDQTPNKFWTLAGRPRLDDKDSRFHFYYRKSASSGSNLMSLTGEGRLGIDKSNPSARLDVNGAMKVAMNEAPSTEGMIRYNASTKDFEGYNGTNWLSLTGSPNTNQTKYAVGDFAQGGIVFWTTPDSLHGKVVYINELIANDGTTRDNWSSVTNLQSGAASLTDGALNTSIIINQSGHTFSAAQTCTNLIANGYDDWYLPAIDEVLLALDNITIVNQAIIDYGGSEFLTGWSSTEDSATTAFIYFLPLSPPNSASNDKDGNWPIRAVRSF